MDPVARGPGGGETGLVMLGTALAAAARMALPKARDGVGAGPHDLAADVALNKASNAVAVELLRRGEAPISEERTEHLARVLLETLGRTDKVRLRPVDAVTGFRSQLLATFAASLEPLKEVGVGLRELGVEDSAEAAAALFVDLLTENLFLWGMKSDLLRDVALLLQVERLRELLPPTPDDVPSPPVVRAWITVETIPPEIYVYNDGSSPIFEVVPTPTLIALDLDGQTLAMVGAGPLTGSRAMQISPDQGYRWPLEHMGSWGGQPLVRSQLHLEFEDNAGRRWRLAHDRLTELS